MKLINFRKIGTVLAIAAFGFISFTAGVDLTQSANSAGSSSALPVSKGGTGATTFASGQALIGNGAGALTTRGIDATPNADSENLITSGAAKKIADDAAVAKGFQNIDAKSMFTATAEDYKQHKVYFIGEYDENSAAQKATSFFGAFQFNRDYLPMYGMLGDADLYISLPYGKSPSNYGNKNAVMKVKAYYSDYTNQGMIDGFTISGYHFELGTFTYQSKNYIGIWVSNRVPVEMHIKGMYKGSLPTKCDGSITICVGTYKFYQDVENWSKINQTA
ncbi:MAG: hypothetical protein LBB07_00110 [Bifidobacteriaceae bacterium]|jgi:hypothetical protein|nr:hypothetical protein [Bifidobacteriaceae bacterium]